MNDNDLRKQLQVRVVSYRNLNGSYYSVQTGRIVKGRWKTLGGSMFRQEKLFCRETLGDAEAKRQAEEYAIEKRRKLADSSTIIG
jgi:hypothetical protein